MLFPASPSSLLLTHFGLFVSIPIAFPAQQQHTLCRPHIPPLRPKPTQMFHPVFTGECRCLPRDAAQTSPVMNDEDWVLNARARKTFYEDWVACLRRPTADRPGCLSYVNITHKHYVTVMYFKSPELSLWLKFILMILLLIWFCVKCWQSTAHYACTRKKRNDIKKTSSLGLVKRSFWTCWCSDNSLPQ